MQETWIQSLGWEDPLEKEMATHTSTLTWKIPWMEAIIHGVSKSRTQMKQLSSSSRDQCKEIEENNRIGKTRDPFKKIRDTKGTFHAKMGKVKDSNAMDLTEAEDFKRR